MAYLFEFSFLDAAIWINLVLHFTQVILDHFFSGFPNLWFVS